MQYPNCSCDPVTILSDCNPSVCKPFFAVFFPLHCLAFIYLIVVTVLMEFKIKQKRLWRIIMACGLVGQCAKTIRTGLLLNPNFRTSIDLPLFFLQNTHFCFGSLAFMSLLFFWARLVHDPTKDQKIYGKLLPLYAIAMVATLIFNYLQVVFKGIWPHSVKVHHTWTYSSAVVMFIMAVVFLEYSFRIWGSFIKPATRGGKKGGFIKKTFISTLISAVLLIIISLLLTAFSISHLTTTRDYILKHTLYESLFIILFMSFPGGFVVHFFKKHVMADKEDAMTKERLIKNGAYHGRYVWGEKTTYKMLYPNCSCDPITILSDCNPSVCKPFFAVFFPLHCLVFIYLIIVTALMEFKIKQKGLWRIIMACGLVGQGAKVIRTGLLLNANFRTSLVTPLFFLYNTHMCFGSFAFLSLLFFWARLLHDSVRDKQLYGKLLPLYIIVMVATFSFNYLQVVFQAVWPHDIKVAYACKYSSGAVTLIMAITFLVYSLLIWDSFLKPAVRGEQKDDLFLKTFIGTFISAVLMIITCFLLIAFGILHLTTTRDYVIKHTIYESLFVTLFLSFPSGFVIHYFKTFVMGDKEDGKDGRKRLKPTQKTLSIDTSLSCSG